MKTNKNKKWHIIIPDCQVKPNVIQTIFRPYRALHPRSKPEVIIKYCDFFDMPSLSSYDKGKRNFEVVGTKRILRWNRRNGKAISPYQGP